MLLVTRRCSAPASGGGTLHRTDEGVAPDTPEPEDQQPRAGSRAEAGALRSPEDNAVSRSLEFLIADGIGRAGHVCNRLGCGGVGDSPARVRFPPGCG